MSVAETDLFKSPSMLTRPQFDLARVVAPLQSASFFEQYWEQKPLLLQRNNSRYYDDLFSLHDLDYIIACTDLRFPAVRMVKDGVAIPLANFTEDVVWGSDTYHGTIIPEKLYRQYRQGASVVFQALHRSWKPLNLFCRDLEKLLHHHVQTNLYLTPKAAQGFKPHYDTHDVFILQIAGSKHWRIYDPPLNLPHRSQPSNNAELQANLGAPLMEFELQAGDCLYLPRGYVHEALTNEQTESLHITVGLTTFTYIEVLTDILNEISQSLRQEEIFRRSLPVGFTGEQPLNAEIKQRFLELVMQQLQASDLQTVAAKLHQRFIDNRAAVLDDYLVQLAALDNLTLNHFVQQRPANVCKLGKDGEQLTLGFSGKTITFPDYVEPSLRFVLAKDEEPFAIGEISGVLNDEAKIVLVKRLITEGFLRLL